MEQRGGWSWICVKINQVGGNTNASGSEARKSKLSQHLQLKEEKLRITKFNMKTMNARNQPRLLFSAKTLLLQILQWLSKSHASLVSTNKFCFLREMCCMHFLKHSALPTVPYPWVYFSCPHDSCYKCGSLHCNIIIPVIKILARQGNIWLIHAVHMKIITELGKWTTLSKDWIHTWENESIHLKHLLWWCHIIYVMGNPWPLSSIRKRSPWYGWALGSLYL